MPYNLLLARALRGEDVRGMAPVIQPECRTPCCYCSNKGEKEKKAEFAFTKIHGAPIILTQKRKNAKTQFR